MLSAVLPLAWMMSPIIFLPFDSFSHDTCFSSSRPFGALLRFVGIYGSQHASPNSGYPEAALAGILDCRFGGPHNYFGEEVWKPYIGSNDRLLTTEDMKVAVRINRRAEGIMIVILIITTTLISFFI